MPLDTLLDRIRVTVESLGYELADVRRGGTGHAPVFTVRIDLPDSRPGHGVTADDCARVSRALEQVLEAVPAVSGRYRLDVSSPGIERPLVFPQHWRRFTGRQVRLRAAGIDGRQDVTIVDVPDEQHVQVRLATGEPRTIPLEAIRDATLVADPAVAPPTKQRRGHRGA